MKHFHCQHCSQLVFFENTRCEQCLRQLGFIAALAELSALEPEKTQYRALADGRCYRLCANAAHGVCNWLIPETDASLYCRACRHNQIIPNLAEPAHLAQWREIENAKHRLFYSLIRLSLPLANRDDDPEHGLMFAFLAENADTSHAKVLTGHENGLITIALNEADAGVRETQRQKLGETYRTLLGHFRHESGHYFWDVLVRDGGKLDAFRALFGDERADYAESLNRHYAGSPTEPWQNGFVSFYATSHPWEDFAESWAHYLHIVDTLETASMMGLRLKPEVREDGLYAKITFDSYETEDFQRIVEAWYPLTIAVNSLNRSMGQPDLYPFVLSPRAIEKLRFIHGLVHGAKAKAKRDVLREAPLTMI